MNCKVEGPKQNQSTTKNVVYKKFKKKFKESLLKEFTLKSLNTKTIKMS